MSRPPELDDLKAHRIAKAIEEGNTRACAARLAGVQPSTLFKWLAKGRAGEPGYVEFAERIRQADAKAEDAMVKVVVKAAKVGDYRAALEWLGRRRRRQWARPAFAAVQDPNAGPAQADEDDFSALSLEELEQLEGLMRKAGTKR